MEANDLREAIAKAVYEAWYTPMRWPENTTEQSRDAGYRAADAVLAAIDANPVLAVGIKSDHVAWLRINDYNGRRAATIHVCDSDAPGAFKVYRHPENSQVSKREPPRLPTDQYMGEYERAQAYREAKEKP